MLAMGVVIRKPLDFIFRTAGKVSRQPSGPFSGDFTYSVRRGSGIFRLLVSLAMLVDGLRDEPRCQLSHLKLRGSQTFVLAGGRVPQICDHLFDERFYASGFADLTSSVLSKHLVASARSSPDLHTVQTCASPVHIMQPFLV